MDAVSAGTVALTAAGGLAALPCLYLLGLAAAALLPGRQAARGPQTHRLAVVVPAHNEVELLPRCVAALRAQSYPAPLTRVVVVADNCTDQTAAVARAAGAEVMVREDPGAPGKGRALRWALDLLLGETDPADAVVVVDADSVADRDLLSRLEGVMASGGEAVQAEYLVLDEGSGSAVPLRQAAFLLFHRTRFLGRSRLGMPCSLVGNGMLLTRPLLERLPWSAFTAAEDLEYSTDLRLAGVRPRFAPGAVVLGPAAGLGRAGAVQRMRWEGGRFHVVRTRLPRLLAACFLRGRWSVLDAAIDLATPPLGLLTLLVGAGGGASVATVLAGAVPAWTAITWGIAAVALAGHVLLGLRAARAPASVYLALLRVPRFLVAKMATYLRMTRGLGADRWERSPRPSDAPSEGDAGPAPAATGGVAAPAGTRRVDVCSVPIDPVDEAGAVDRILGAVGSGKLLHVCTINLQFLVSARRNPEVRAALRASGLNLADGAPVVWLSRILGRPLRGRVAGADLVPALAARASREGARLFLLGGSGGIAAAAARVLQRDHPGLTVCGIHEPPVSSLEAMDTDGIVRLVERARADILLVGLGHPKQDLWIARNRARLPVSAAIGVGGTFDLIAGRLPRAPGWARRSGLEWLFRLLHEPRRLGLRYAACATWLVGVLLPMAAWRRLMRAEAVIDGAPEIRDADVRGEAMLL